MDAFLQGYITCALWSSLDNADPFTGGEPLGSNYCADDIAPATLDQMRQDCADFQSACRADLEATGATDERNGHDFWLTRNHHGAGFWNRGYGIVGDKLTAAAHVYGDVDLIVGDDGLIYS